MAGGRPRKFKSVEELEEKINKYFGSITITEPLTKSVIVGYKDNDKEKPICKEIPVVNNNGEQVFIDKYFKNPTIGDMCIFLDITRDTLLNYEKLPEYLGTIKKAKGKIEAFLEQELYREKGHTGLIFNLKNYENLTFITYRFSCFGIYCL